MSCFYTSYIFTSSNFMPAISSVCFTFSIFSHPMSADVTASVRVCVWFFYQRSAGRTGRGYLAPSFTVQAGAQSPTIRADPGLSRPGPARPGHSEDF